MLLGLLVGGPGMGAMVADDNRGKVDVVALITHSDRRTQSLLLSDAATLSASALTPFSLSGNCCQFVQEYGNI